MKGFYIVLFNTLILAACAPSEGITQTAVPISTSTITPLPASTPTPTLTPTPIPPTLTPLPTLGVGSTMISPKDNMIMMYIPEGEFTMGTDDGLAEEGPAHSVYISAFWIDQTTITNGQYIKCFEAGICSEPAYPIPAMKYYSQEEYANHPVIMVDWENAVTYCTWAGKRLPTEAEWEKAARGTDARLYPWGNNLPTCSFGNIPDCRGDFVNEMKTLSPVGSFPDGRSPYGVYDIIGNAWEWVFDWYDSSYYINSPTEDPAGPITGKSRVLRGGSAFQNAKVITRMALNPERSYFNIPGVVKEQGYFIAQYPSFRCAMDVAQ